MTSVSFLVVHNYLDAIFYNTFVLPCNIKSRGWYISTEMNKLLYMLLQDVQLNICQSRSPVTPIFLSLSMRYLMMPSVTKII